jgi:hypothetical protein
MTTGVTRLDSWKEIACYLKRSVRCVQRWEHSENLPVRRHGHARGMSVYAFREELDAWWQDERRVGTEALSELPSGIMSKAKGPKHASQGPARLVLGADSRESVPDNRNYPQTEQLAWEIAVILLKMLESVAHREHNSVEVGPIRVARPSVASSRRAYFLGDRGPLTASASRDVLAG